MEIKNAKFTVSCSSTNNMPNYERPEIAICGKSNVGKSSFINFLANNGKLARTSSDPGRTRLVNFFEMNKGQFYLVDLPGYGYAKVSKAEQKKWAPMIEGYLLNSRNLIHIFVLLDIRHEPTQDDIQMINYLFHYNFAFSIIATKADKLSRAQQKKAMQTLAQCLGMGVDNIYPISSVKKTGKDEVLQRIEQILLNTPFLL